MPCTSAQACTSASTRGNVQHTSVAAARRQCSTRRARTCAVLAPLHGGVTSAEDGIGTMKKLRLITGKWVHVTVHLPGTFRDDAALTERAPCSTWRACSH